MTFFGESAEVIERKQAEINAAYLERNQVVAGLASLAISLGYHAGIKKTAIEGWSNDWNGCVYIDLPTGQVSWHYHDSQAGLFDFLPAYEGKYDGHTTAEKYERVLALRNIIVTTRRKSMQLAKWIVNHKPSLPDHACIQCVPGGDMIANGFECGYHMALRIISESNPS